MQFDLQFLQPVVGTMSLVGVLSTAPTVDTAGSSPRLSWAGCVVVSGAPRHHLVHSGAVVEGCSSGALVQLVVLLWCTGGVINIP